MANRTIDLATSPARDRCPNRLRWSPDIAQLTQARRDRELKDNPLASRRPGPLSSWRKWQTDGRDVPELTWDGLADQFNGPVA
jgi:hypothetical protein